MMSKMPTRMVVDLLIMFVGVGSVWLGVGTGVVGLIVAGVMAMVLSGGDALDQQRWKDQGS